jgi:diacylglycerol O-acyltransferase / wax synthase
MMRQLSMTDAFMLAAENRRQTLQMASVSILAAPEEGQRRLTREVLRNLVAERIHLAPALTRKLVHVPLGLDHPYWVDDADIDIDFHVRDLALPTPGDDRQLAEKVAQLVAQPLDHSRPLWELYLIEGLEGGRSALVFKLHHASVDGISGLDLHEMLFDSAPEGRNVPPAKAPSGEPVPSPWRMLARGLASLPTQAMGAVGGGARSLPYLDHLMPFCLLPGVGKAVRTSRRVAGLLPGTGDGKLLEGGGLRAPQTVFDKPITPHRRWAFVRVPLDEAKGIRRRYGVTLNDVVVATMAGAVRRWMQEIEALPDEPLVAMVPISVRPEEAESGGNLVQVMLVPLPTNESSAERRLVLTHETLRSAKERHRAVPASAMQGADTLMMPALFIRATRAATLLTGLAGASANTVISNVPGPPNPVYVAGARVEALYPVGGIIEGFGGFTSIVFSYCGGLDLGIVTDRETPADPWRLAELYKDSQAELALLAAGRRVVEMVGAS